MEIKDKFVPGISSMKGSRTLPNQDSTRNLSTGIIKRIEAQKIPSNWLKFKQKGNNRPPGETIKTYSRYPPQPPNTIIKPIQKTELNFTKQQSQQPSVKNERNSDQFRNMKNMLQAQNQNTLQNFSSQSIYNSNIIFSEKDKLKTQQLQRMKIGISNDISKTESSLSLLGSDKNQSSRVFMKKDVQLQGKDHQKYITLEKQLFQIKDKLKISQNECIQLKSTNQQCSTKIKDMENKIHHLQEKVSQNIIGLRDLQLKNRKSEESLKISRNIIASLNQKNISSLKNHENIIKANNQDFSKKIEQIRISVELREKTKYENIIKTLQTTNFELKLQLIDEANGYEETIKKLQFSNQLLESDKNILLKEKNNLKNISLHKEIAFKELNQRFLALDTQNKQFYDQNLHFLEYNKNLNEQIKRLNIEFKHIQSKNTAKYVQIKQKLQNQKIQRFNQTKRLNEALISKENDLHELKIRIMHQHEQNNYKFSEQEGKLETMHKQLQGYQMQIQILKEQKLRQHNIQKTDLQSKDNKIDQLEKQINRLTLDIDLKNQLNNNNNNEVEILKGQLTKVKEQLSNFKSQADAMQKAVQQKQIQLPSRQQQFEQLEDDYRQILADEIKRISEMYDQNSENKLKFSESDYQKNIPAVKLSYNKDSQKNDSYVFDQEMENKNELFSRIEDLTSINHALHQKLQEMQDMDEKANKLILAKIRKFEIHIWQSQKNKEQLQQNYLQISFKMIQLSKKCQTYKSKLQQMKQKYKQLEAHLLQTTEQLMKSKINLIQFKFAHNDQQPLSQQYLSKQDQILNINQNCLSQLRQAEKVQILTIQPSEIIDSFLYQEQGQKKEQIKQQLNQEQRQYIEFDKDNNKIQAGQNVQKQENDNTVIEINNFQFGQKTNYINQQSHDLKERRIPQSNEVQQNENEQQLLNDNDKERKGEKEQLNTQQNGLVSIFVDVYQQSQVMFTESQQSQCIIVPENQPISDNQQGLNQNDTNSDLEHSDSTIIAEEEKLQTIDLQQISDQ